MDARANKRERSTLRWWIWLTYAALFAVSIPWYWPADDQTLWLGMPAWATIAVVGSFAVSTFTAVLIWRCWPEPDDESAADDLPQGGPPE